MKKNTFMLPYIVVVVCMVVLTSFNSSNEKLISQSPTCYYYKAGACNQQLAPGYTGQNPCCENSITAATFKDVNNWTKTATECTAGTAYICKICFVEEPDELDEDGGADGQLTLNEALIAIWAAYTSPNPDAMPNSVTVNSNAVITITKKGSCQ